LPRLYGIDKLKQKEILGSVIVSGHQTCLLFCVLVIFVNYNSQNQENAIYGAICKKSV